MAAVSHPEATPPEAPQPPRAGSREAWVVVGLVLAGALGVLLLLLSDVFRPRHGSAPEEAPTAVDDEAAGRLRGEGSPPKAVPPAAVDVLVVSKDRQEPVPDVEVRLWSVLGGPEPDPGARARTGPDGRARLAGEVPGFAEVVSPEWRASPPIATAEGGREVRFEVSPRGAWRATLLDAVTGLPLPAWWLSPAGTPPGTEPARTDASGTVSWAGVRAPPTMVAAWDGRRRVHSFLLFALEDRTELRLAMPAAVRTTRVRVVDRDRRPVEGGSVRLISETTGVSIDLDARGEADLEYGGREAVAVTVVSPGFVPRAIALDGQPVVTVVLEPATTRAFRLRRPDGGDVPDGTRVRGYTHGPLSYGENGPGQDFRGTTAGGVARVEGLPASAFEGILEASGPGVLALVRFAASDDPADAVNLVAGPPRAFALRLAHAGRDGVAEPYAGWAWVRGTVTPPPATDPSEARAAFEDAVRQGVAGEPFATIAVRTGPEVPFTAPSCAEARAVQVAGSSGEYACVEIGPADAGGARDVLLAATSSRPPPPSTTLLVEWEDGVPAALVELEVRRDERDTPATRLLTDSSGTAILHESSGRFLVATTRPDGARFGGDGPLLLPAPGVALVRLTPVGR